MSDPNASGGVSVTLKQDSREGTWMVFHGSVDRVKEDICKAFGWEADPAWTLDDVRRSATAAYKGSSAVSVISDKLGGTPPKADSEPAPPWNGGSAWDKAREGGATDKPAEPPVNPVLAQIEESTSVDELRKLYARNEAEFKTNADLLTAWKARGKALKAAA